MSTCWRTAGYGSASSSGLTLGDIDRQGDAPAAARRHRCQGRQTEHRAHPPINLSEGTSTPISPNEQPPASGRMRVTERAPLFVPAQRLSAQSTVRRRPPTAPRGGSRCRLPEGAMTHALRHSYGMELALRGVPLPGHPAAPRPLGPPHHQHLHHRARQRPHRHPPRRRPPLNCQPLDGRGRHRVENGSPAVGGTSPRPCCDSKHALDVVSAGSGMGTGTAMSNTADLLNQLNALSCG